MSRKTPSFGQLLRYIDKGAEEHNLGFTRNLYALEDDHQAVIDQFHKNFSYLPDRKGGNALYHEVIVLEPQPHLTKGQINEALLSLAEQYCKLRAPDHLAWGQVHFDTAFPHIHLMISANEVRSHRRTRLGRRVFAQIQRDMKIWREENFPQLNGQRLYNRDHSKDRSRIKTREGEAIHRSGEPSQKQQISAELRPIFQTAQTKDHLQTALRDQGFDLYLRGQTWGVIRQSDGRRFRLRTLGLTDAFEAVLVRSEVKKEKRRPEVDSRANALLRQRMHQTARDELDRFERD